MQAFCFTEASRFTICMCVYIYIYIYDTIIYLSIYLSIYLCRFAEFARPLQHRGFQLRRLPLPLCMFPVSFPALPSYSYIKHISLSLYIYIYIYICTHTYVHKYICVYVYMYACVYDYISLSLCIYIHIYMYTCIHVLCVSGLSAHSMQEMPFEEHIHEVMI